MKKMNRESAQPKLVIMVTYRKKGRNGWRGFCAPYDVSCNAHTLEEAQNRIEALVELYEEGLKKYGYPKHLTVKPLSYPEDRKVFKGVLGEVAADISKTMVNRFQSYQTETQKKLRISVGSSTPAVARYYSPQLTTV